MISIEKTLKIKTLSVKSSTKLSEVSVIKLKFIKDCHSPLV